MTARPLVAVLAAVLLAACARKPLTAPRAVVPETVASSLRIAASESRDFGSMVAFGVGLSNGEGATYLVAPERIFAVDGAGYRIAPLSVGEASRQAGGSTALMAGLEGAGGSAVLAGLLGAVPGALIGAVQGGGSGAAAGAAIGGGIGMAAGALGGFFESKEQTERQIQGQLRGLHLGEQVLRPGIPVSGFVFFPKGDYVTVRAVLVDQQSNVVREVEGPLLPPA